MERNYRYYEFGEFRLDADQQVLRRNGEIVHLTLKVFQLLLALVERSGQVVGKNELMEMVWPDTIVEEANLKNGISTLRKALGDERGAAIYIQTIPKRGYRFVAQVIALPDEDETYLIEKRTTAEIVIDELEVDNQPLAAREARAEVASHDRSALTVASTEAGGALIGSANPLRLAGAPLAGKRRLALSRNQKRAIAGALLIAALGLAIGLYRWISAIKRPAVSFAKMEMSTLINVGNGGAVISPDGKYIAYIMDDGAETDGLWVRQTATDSAVKLLPHLSCWGITFTRDSNYVYCVAGGAEHPEGALYKVPALGGPARLVLNKINGKPSFSPDGARMAFKRYGEAGGNPELVTASPDGGDQRVVLPANSRYAIWDYDWSPDGKTIVLAVRSDVAQGQITCRVLEVSADGGPERPLTEPQKEFITTVTWLPDGSGLTLTAIDKTTGLPQLWLLSYPDSQTTRITNDSNWYTGASFTASGETMLATRNAGGKYSIWIGDAGDLNGLRKTTAEGFSLRWTPDGKLLYAHGGDGKFDLWMMRDDATERQRLTNDQSQNGWPVMTRDRRYIVFSSRRGGSRQIWRMDGDGRNFKQLTSEASECYAPQVTADGQWVIYSTWIPPSGWTAKRVSIDGGEPLTAAAGAGEFVISPDGKRLAYQSFDEQKKRNVIQIKPVGADEPIKRLDFADFPIFRIEQWTADGLLSISANSAQIILLPVDGQPPRQLSRFNTGERIFSLALSEDGKRMAVARGVVSQEAVMITHFKPQ